jgi:glycosyltransferase involved in cell wall biosynthesis
VIIDAVVPARNEASTIADVIAALHGAEYVRDVIVVDDGSSDGTAGVAAAAGATVVRRNGERGSKAHAMAAGVAATNAEAVFFVDADLIGVTSAHLDAICRPLVENRCVMSIGTFDYGWRNPLVLRLPPTTGERVMPRWVFESIPPERLQGFTIEVMINEVIAEGRFPTVARVMKGVTHRTKREKFGRVEGWRRTARMFRSILALPFKGVVRWRIHYLYLRNLTIERSPRAAGR